MRIFDDRLSKYQEIENIVNIINSCVDNQKPVTFSIEGAWGAGKTWTLEKIEAKLKGLDLSKTYTPTELKRASSDYFIITYNAWEKDYCEEPLIAILLSIINQLNEKLVFFNVLKEGAKELLQKSLFVLEGLLSSLSKRLLGINIIDTAKTSIKELKEFKKKGRIATSSTTKAENIENDILLVVKTLNEISSIIPIVFFVDELDRCIPIQAIKNLERLHHIFSKINHSVTIISVYREQLDKSIKEMFGVGIATEEYLRKFIDFKVVLTSGIVDDEVLEKKLEPLSSLFNYCGADKRNSPIINAICKNTNSRDFENLCTTALLCHKIVNIDTMDLPYCCFEAELLLQAYRLASEKELSESSLSPKYLNTAKTPIGKYISEYLKEALSNKQYKENSYWDSKLLNEVSLSDATSVILYIFDIVHDYKYNWVIKDSEKEQLNKIKTYYMEYKKYYKLIK